MTEQPSPLPEPKQRRFLLVTWDGAGNLPPELSLAAALVRRGHRVDVLAQDCLKARIESAGCGFLPLHYAAQWSSADVLRPEEEGAFYWNNCVFAREYADDTKAAIEQGAYDALLIDSFLTFALVAAIASPIPTIALVHSLYDTLAAGPMAGAIDAGLSSAGKALKDLGITNIRRFEELLDATEAQLVFSFSEFDRTRSSGLVHVGPLRSAEHSTAWSRRLADCPLVLVSLSTAYQSQAGLLQRICDALAPLAVEAIVTTGPAVEPSELHASDNISVVQYLPHEAVLPEASLLITHAGHGTVVAGVQHGVPILCLPMGRDQPVVAARVAELGLGTIVDPTSSAEELRQAVTALLEDHSVHSACRQFAANLTTHPGLEHAIELVEEASAGND